MPVRVRLLGVPAVHHDGAWSTPAWSRQTALAYHLACKGDWVSREELAYLFWPDLTEARARANLRKLLSRALGELPPAAGIEAERSRLRWRVDSDLREFLAALEAATWDEAVRCYGGELLQGFRLDGVPEYERWLEGERRTLALRWRAAALEHVAALEADGAFDRAAEVLARLTEADPFDEDTLRRRLDALDRSGRQRQAVDAFDAFSAFLDDEVGGEPEPATRQLIERIRQVDASEDVSAAPLAGGPAPVVTVPADMPPGTFASGPDTGADPPFVAREAELGQLELHLDEVLAGRHRTLLVAGEAGLGKTALLEAFARRAQRREPTLIVASGNCNAYTGIGDPYLPFREILEQLSGDMEARTAAAVLHPDNARRLWENRGVALAALLEHGPDLIGSLLAPQGLLSRADDAVLRSRIRERIERAERVPDASLQPGALVEQVARTLQAVARRTPLLLLIDDLQWVDAGSAALLLHLGKRLRGYPVLILGAFRPAETALGRGGERHPLEPVIAELKRDQGEIVLDLARAEGRRLVDGMIDAEPNALGSDFRATLHELTRGHPLFTLELLRGMQERGDLVRDAAGRWRQGAALDWDALPARVEGAIGARVGRLSDELVMLLRVASVEGEVFTAEAVALALALDPRGVVRRLSRELDRTHRLVQALGVRREGAVRLTRYRFRHILIQRYLYLGLDQVERVDYHEVLGEALEALHRTDPDGVVVQLARHFRLAGRNREAARYLAQAGDQARRSVALVEAARAYQEALELDLELPPIERASLLRRLGEVLWPLGRLDEALEVFERAFASFEAAGDRADASAVQRHIGRIHWELGDRTRSLEHYRRALAILDGVEHDPSASDAERSELAWAISSMSQMLMLSSDSVDAIRWGERALALAGELGAEDVRVHALNNVGVCRMQLGEIDAGVAMVEESAERAIELGLPHEACRALGNLAEDLTKIGRYDDARRFLVRLRAYAEEKQLPLFLGGSLANAVSLDWLTGDWRAVLPRFGELDRLTGHGSINYVRVIVAIQRSAIDCDLGRADAALERLDAVEALVRGRDEPQTTGPYLSVRGCACAELGRASEADAAFAELLELHRGFGRSFYPLVQLFAERGLIGASVRALEQGGTFDDLAGLLSRGGSEADRVAAAMVAEVEGRAAACSQDPGRAPERLRAAAQLWRQLGRPLDEARARLELARSLGAADRDEARAALDRALELTDDLAAQLEGSPWHASFLGSPLVRSIREAHEAAADAADAAPAGRALEQTVRFCTSSDGVRIAYATVGSGPPLVKVANFLSHLEFDWTSPIWRHWTEAFSERHTFVRYDERGSGLSDWDVDDVSFESWVRDLEAVVDALELERFPLFALSQGCAVAVAYAARHPERVSRLVLYGGYARGWRHRELNEAQREEERAWISLMRIGWGRDNPAFRQFFGAALLPEASREQIDALDQLMRVSATPENAARLEDEMHRVDVRELAPRVRVPALVLHPRGDAGVPFDEGRLLAALLPDARFVALDSRNHILRPDEPAWERFLGAVRGFLDEESDA